MKKNEKGFSAVEMLLILVIVGLIGFVGWYVWQSKNKHTTATSNTSHLENKVTKKEPEAANLNTYKSDEIGISLNYPAEWGMASLVDGSLSKFQSGKYKQLNFSKAANASIDFVTGAYSSPLDACGYDDPVQNAQHAQNATQASIIGWEGNNIKRYLITQTDTSPTVYKENMTAGDTGSGWTEITKNDKVLVYKNIDRPENRVKASGSDGLCSSISQTQADAANAFLNFFHYTANYSNSKVIGVNAQYDARKGDDSTIRNQLIEVLGSIK